MKKVEVADEEFVMDSVYPESNDVKRFKVVAKYKSWSVIWKKYSPIKYTSHTALLRPEADLDLVS